MSDFFSLFPDGRGTIGIVGLGNMGPGIGTRLAEAFPGITLVGTDIKPNRLDATDAIWSEHLPGRFDLDIDPNILGRASLVFEVATEREDFKCGDVLPGICRVTKPHIGIVSNTSGIPVARWSTATNRPGLCINAHHFNWPGQPRVNWVVELAAGPETDPAYYRAMLGFFLSAGYFVLPTADQYGLALNCLFHALDVETKAVIDDGITDDPRMVDAVTMDLIGTMMYKLGNKIGGVPIAMEALPHLGREVHPFYRVTTTLATQFERKQPWPEAKKGETIEVPAAVRDAITARVLPVALAFGGWLASRKIGGQPLVDPALFECGVQLAFGIPGPVAATQKCGGPAAVNGVIAAYNAKHSPNIPVPNDFLATAPKRAPAFVVIASGDVAIIHPCKLPKLGNPLDPEVLAEFDQVRVLIDDDDRFVASVVVGAGPFFCNGANLKKVGTAITQPNATELMEAMIVGGKNKLRKQRRFKKPCFAAVHGDAHGGGVEFILALDGAVMADTARASTPECKLGILPGWYGATWAACNGEDPLAAVQMVRTGQALEPNELQRLGVVNEVVPRTVVVTRAMDLAREAAAEPKRRRQLPQVCFPGGLPELPLTADGVDPVTDDIIVSLFRDIVGMTFDEAAEIETARFCEAAATEVAKGRIAAFLAPKKR